MAKKSPPDPIKKGKKARIITNSQYPEFEEEYQRTKGQYEKHYPGGVEFIKARGYYELKKAFGNILPEEDLIMMAHYNRDSMYGVPVSDPEYQTLDAPKGKTIAGLFGDLQGKGYKGNCYLGICDGENIAKDIQGTGVDIPMFATPSNKKWFGANPGSKGDFEDFFFGITEGKKPPNYGRGWDSKLSEEEVNQHLKLLEPQSIIPQIGKDYLMNISPRHQELMNRRSSGTPVTELTTLPEGKSGAHIKKGKKAQEGMQLGGTPTLKEQLDAILLKNALLEERQHKRDSALFSFTQQYPNKASMVSKKMSEYYKTEPPEYLELNTQLLNTKRKQQLLGVPKGQYGYSEPSNGFSESDLYQGQTPISLYNQQKPYSSFDQVTGAADPNMLPISQGAQGGNRNGKIWGNVLQGAGAIGNLRGGSMEQGPSVAQQAVGAFGPIGAAISGVSQGITKATENSESFGGQYLNSIADPFANFTDKDIPKEDRFLATLSPTYGAIIKQKAVKARKNQQRQLDDLYKRASESQDIDANRRRYVRPEDQMVESSQSYGIGTNYLKHGGEIPYMEKKGELETYWGGGADHLSQNPYLPEGGETVMFKGKSHEQGGIGMKFGKSTIEVEGGEPAVKLNEGGDTSLVIFGDMKIPSYGVTELNDPKAKGRKFKNYINELSKVEDKQNKVIEKGLDLINSTEPIDSFDKLKLSSGKAMIEGGNMKLKQIAQKKQIASSIQQAILETAEELHLDSGKLAKGKFQKAKMGKKIKYQNGSPFAHQTNYDSTLVDDGFADSVAAPDKGKLGGLSWMDAFNAVLPYLRPSNQTKFDPNQLAGERYVLSNNQLEPVQAQTYSPLLENVSDISYQDQLNANQADFNALKRLTAQNPAAQSVLAAQKYAANSSVLGEEFRQNQNNRIGVYNRNRATLNDATLKNLAILDQQYVRQSQAKSNTKAVAQTALSSIADKMTKHKLENRTLGIYENLYNYRFGPRGQAFNMNPLAQFNVPEKGSLPTYTGDENTTTMEELQTAYDNLGRVIGQKKKERTTTTPNKKGGRNGGIVKAIKSL